MNRIIRVPSLCFIVGLLLCPLPAHAQGGGGGGTLNLTAIAVRVTALETALAAETAARIAAVAGEAAARATADTTLQSNITTEVTNRVGAVAAEISDRAAADTTLQGQIDKLNGNITASDLEGNYAFHLVGASIDPRDPSDNNPSNRVSSYAISGTATLVAGGTGSLNGTLAGLEMSEGFPSQFWQVASGGEPQSFNLNWTYDDVTRTVTIVPAAPIGNITLSVAAGGQIFVAVKGGAPGNNQQVILWARRP